MKIIAILSVLFFGACTTTEGTVGEVDTELNNKGQVGLSKVGVNEDGQAIVQTETSADDELRIQTWKNKQKEDDVTAVHDQLKQCREDMADPRLGGSGELKEIPDVDGLKSPSDVKEAIGIDSRDGSLKVVKKEIYTKRLKQERRYETSLKGMLKTLKNYRASCERKMRQARVKAGLPGERYKAQGYVSSSGAWIETLKGEKSLDDAFEIRALLKKKM
ncbi:hypothetical protein N9D31_02610 [Oligoflexaceae bacterium]|nr:hypothetical protein [Oligoflexaceae bacterium]